MTLLTLPIHARLAAHYDSQNEEMMDDTTRSATICWNGCPECVNQLQNTLGGMLHEFHWQIHPDECGLTGIGKFWRLSISCFSEMASGDADMHFGSPNRLHLITPMGSPNAQFVYRWLYAMESPLKPNWLSVPLIWVGSVLAMTLACFGYWRAWFWTLALVQSAHDFTSWCSWALPKEKIIQLLYYDARDLQLKDLGLSPRMLDSMQAVSDGEPLEKLSDVLWRMLRRGFKITLWLTKNKL